MKLLFLILGGAVFALDFYVVSVTTEHGVTFTGDYNGVFEKAGTYQIGPYSEPFTVNLMPLDNYVTVAEGTGISSCYWAEIETFNSWIVEGEYDSNWELAVSTKPGTNIIRVQEEWNTIHADDFECAVADISLNPGTLNLNLSSNSSFVTTCNVSYSTTSYSYLNYSSDSFSFEIIYDPSLIEPDSSIGTLGVTNTVYSSDINASMETPGHLIISGVNTDYKDREQLDFFTVNWKTLKTGQAVISIEPLMERVSYYRLVRTYVQTQTVTISLTDSLPGDLDENGIVDILDALQAARCAAGLFPCHPRGDVNEDGEVTIIDALLIARKSIGLISSF